MIKINDVNKSEKLKIGKNIHKTSGGESFSTYLNKTITTQNKQVTSTSSISVTDAIFATQMVGEEEERQIRKKLVKRGFSLLEKLEDIRDGLLLGEISKDNLIEISKMVKEQKINTQDGKLKEIIEEIELRVEVELAKLIGWYNRW